MLQRAWLPGPWLWSLSDALALGCPSLYQAVVNWQVMGQRAFVLQAVQAMGPRHSENTCQESPLYQALHQCGTLCELMGQVHSDKTEQPDLPSCQNNSKTRQNLGHNGSSKHDIRCPRRGPQEAGIIAVSPLTP